VYNDLCDEKVLVMEYVPSIKINNATALLDANVTAADFEYLADCLARAYLRQFCCHHFFSTDPHPGNLGVEILDPKGKTPQTRVRLVFYDFGQSVGLKPSQGEGILDVLEAIVDMNVDKSVRAFQKMGVLNDGADLHKVRAKVADNFQKGKVQANRKRLAKRGYGNIKSKDRDALESPMTTKQEAIVNDDATTLPTDAEIMQSFTLLAEYAFVSRALVQMHGVGKFLDEDFDFISAAAPFIYEIKGVGAFLLGQISKCWGKQEQRKIKQIDSKSGRE
jgi:predicted unusual protein kinase regulating ubiquinone biosynthesis (AarF/ABC1/UbiB family)